MSLPSNLHRPLAPLKYALRHCRAVRSQRRYYATAQAESVITEVQPPISEALYPSLQSRRGLPTEGFESLYPAPTKGFRPSRTMKQNRMSETLRKIRTYPPPRSSLKTCPDPIKLVTNEQIAKLDPTGARTRLFSPNNPDRVKLGDILLVRLKNGDPFSGVCLVIRQRHQPVDTAILLRNQLTRVGVEMWYKIYSPNVEGIEVVQRKQGKRARRAKLYYMRKPKHDAGSVENTVRAYLRNRAGGPVASRNAKGTAASSGKKASKKGKKK